MAWEKASLKLVFETDEQNAQGTGYKTKSKSFSNLKQGATAQGCTDVANALEPLQAYSLIEVYRIDTDRLA